jgi:broad specificity phosphatase PhoE
VIFLVQKQQPLNELQLWHGTLIRTKNTAQPLKPLAAVVRVWRDLNEISVGLCDGMTDNEFKQKMPFVKIFLPIHHLCEVPLSIEHNEI